MKTFFGAIGILFVGILWLVGIAVSTAVPVAIIWAAYHFITTYKG
jgi:hypothetical protein